MHLFAAIRSSIVCTVAVSVVRSTHVRCRSRARLSYYCTQHMAGCWSELNHLLAFALVYADWAANRGLEIARGELDKIKDQFPWVTYVCSVNLHVFNLRLRPACLLAIVDQFVQMAITCTSDMLLLQADVWSFGVGASSQTLLPSYQRTQCYLRSVMCSRTRTCAQVCRPLHTGWCSSSGGHGRWVGRLRWEYLHLLLVPLSLADHNLETMCCIVRATGLRSKPS